MKVFTLIPPRRDGTVVVDVADTRYVFKADASGYLACDVANEHLSALMRIGGMFQDAKTISSHDNDARGKAPSQVDIYLGDDEDEDCATLEDQSDPLAGRGAARSRQGKTKPAGQS